MTNGIEHVAANALASKPVFAADPLNLFVVVEAGNHHVTVLDGDRFEPLTRFASRYALHGGPKFSPDGRFVYFASRDGWISKYDIYNLKMVAEVRAGIAAAVALVLFLGRDRVSDGVRYETYFRESVQGLDVGAPVKFRGVTLGQVTEIGLVTTAYMADQAVDARRPEARMVVVRWVIDPKRMGRVPDQATAIDLGLRAAYSSMPCCVSR